MRGRVRGYITAGPQTPDAYCHYCYIKHLWSYQNYLCIGMTAQDMGTCSCKCDSIEIIVGFNKTYAVPRTLPACNTSSKTLVEQVV